MPFGAVLTGDMFQRRTNEILKGLPNVLGIVDDILAVECDMNCKKP